MIWHELSDDYESQRLQDYADTYEASGMRKLRIKFPGLPKSVAKCICYAAIDGEEYALDIAAKCFLDDRDMYSILEVKNQIERCAFEDAQQTEE